MRFEFSAGGVVFKKDPSASSGQAGILVLVCQHALHHGWVFPKGLIGDKDHLKGEKKEDTAVREVKEETGIDAEIIEKLKPVTYWYVFNGEKIKKTVYYFVMKHVGGDFAERDHEMENVEWIPLEQADEKLTYKSDKQVFIEARPVIERLVKSA